MIAELSACVSSGSGSYDRSQNWRRLRLRRSVESRFGSSGAVWAFLPLLRRPEPNQDLPPQKLGRTLGNEGSPHRRGDKEIRFARADNPA